jgi:hypothetical protein
MRHFNTPAMISQARKAGLRTSEVYASLRDCPPEEWSPTSWGKPIDANGFMANYNPDGHVSYETPPARWNVR